MSGEGVFIAVETGTARERRLFFDGADAAFEVYIDVPALRHKGRDVSGVGLKAQVDMAIATMKIWCLRLGAPLIRASNNSFKPKPLRGSA